MTYAVNAFLWCVAGFVAGVWLMAWAQKSRHEHEIATEDAAREYEKQFDQMKLDMPINGSGQITRPSK